MAFHNSQTVQSRLSRASVPCEPVDMSELHRLDRLEAIPEPIPEGVFVVVDVIISSTSIVRLLEEGAEYVKPFADPDEARQFGEQTDDAVLVGEDAGKAIDGFDLSPLPSIIESADLEGRPVGIRTSNGTRAMDRLGYRDGLFVGSTVNAGAVADRLRATEKDVWIVAAGRQGNPVDEDIAGAKLIENHYHEETDEETNDELRDVIQSSVTADWLRQIGFENELDELLEFGSTETVPRLEDGVFVAE